MPNSPLPLENVSFQSKSSSTIHGWFLQGEADKGGILLMHGVRSNRLQMLNRASFLYEAGYSVLLFDFQGHGESKGDKITFGYLEALDAQAGYVYLKERIGEQRVGVIGVSLGGASALLGEVKYLSDAMVLESVYPSIEKATFNRIKERIGILGAYLTPILMLQLKVQLGINPNQLQPSSQINKTKTPIFIIGGKADLLTTTKETKMLYHQANFPKKLWIIKGAGHINFDSYIEKEYRERILEFFEKYL